MKKQVQIQKSIKLYLVGSKFSGKTSFVQKLQTGNFDQFVMPTLMANLYSRQVKINQVIHSVSIWDTQGFDRKTGVLLIPQYKKADGFIIMYDITSKSSFQNVKQCVEQIKNNCFIQNQHILLIGNKDDLQQKRKVTMKQVMQYTNQQELEFRQISVKKYTPQQLQKLVQGRIKLLVAKIIAQKATKINSNNFLNQNQDIKLDKPKNSKPFWKNFCLGLKNLLYCIVRKQHSQ